MEGDAGSTKYAPLGQIDADNIEQLQVVWQWTNSDTAVLTSNELGVGAFKATPIMVHGVLYVRTSLIGSGATPGGTSTEACVISIPARRRTWSGTATSGMCSGFSLVDDFTSIRWKPPGCRSRISTATNVLVSRKLASNMAAESPAIASRV